MQFAKSTDYALHALVHLANSEREDKIGIKELADMLDVSESYLSKIMTQLRKDGIVRAVPGVKGGYELARPASQITFLDVILSTEGRQEMFNCSNSDSKQHTSMTNESNEIKGRINAFVELKRSWIMLKVPYINFSRSNPYNLF